MNTPDSNRFTPRLFNLNRWEKYFLSQLRKTLIQLSVKENSSLRITVSTKHPNDSYLQLTISHYQVRQPAQIMIHGIKPVRYHIRTANTAIGRKLRRYLSHTLGEENLNLTISNQTGPELSLVYHVDYPDDILRKLGS